MSRSGYTDDYDNDKWAAIRLRDWLESQLREKEAAR